MLWGLNSAKSIVFGRVSISSTVQYVAAQCTTLSISCSSHFGGFEEVEEEEVENQKD
jgi:hypothetical protein